MVGVRGFEPLRLLRPDLTNPGGSRSDAILFQCLIAYYSGLERLIDNYRRLRFCLRMSSHGHHFEGVLLGASLIESFRNINKNQWLEN